MSNTTQTAYNEANEKYLKNGLWYGGFGDRLYDDLVKNLKAGKPEFQLKDKSKYSGPKIEYLLDYKYSKDYKRYDWPGFRATAKDNPEQTLYFPLVKNKGFTATEAAGLVQGLPVCKKERRGKEIVSKTWHQIDFSQKDANGNFVENKYYENHGFDTYTAANQLPIVADNKEWFLEAYVDALEKGKMALAKMDYKGQVTPTFSTVNLAEKAIDVYNDKSELIIRKSGINEEMMKQIQYNEKKQEQQSKVINNITQRIIPRPITPANGATSKGKKLK